MTVLSDRIGEAAGMIIARQFCRGCRKSDDKRDAGLATPDDVERFDNIAYGSDPVWQVLDLYRPKTAGPGLPVIISVHGGGWVYGTKETYQFYCMDLARRGFAVINYSYRLAPDNRFPAPIEDLNSVIGWLFANADKYGLSTQNVFAVGDSAGAHTLSLYACLCANPDLAACFAQNYGIIPPAGFSFTAVGLNCGKYTAEKELHGLAGGMMRVYLPKENPEEALRLLQVTDHVTGKFPPAFVMTANADFLKDEAPLMKAALEKRGVPCVFRCYGDEQTQLGHVFHCDIRNPAAKICSDDECAFFHGYLDLTEPSA